MLVLYTNYLRLTSTKETKLYSRNWLAFPTTVESLSEYGVYDNKEFLCTRDEWIINNTMHSLEMSTYAMNFKQGFETTICLMQFNQNNIR